MPTITGTSGNDTLNGTSGDDIINGLAGDDVLNGGDGNDVLNGGDGNDTIDGGPGTDTVTYADASSAVSVDLMAVSAAQSTLGSGYDWIRNVENLEGSAFNDFLEGDSGANHISGGAGNDTLVGGGGADVLTGGSGNDWFIYGNTDGAITITDLTAGDRIALEGYTSAQSVTQVGSNVLVTFSATDQITCLNTDVATVQAALPHPSSFTQPPSTIIPLLPARPASTTVTATVALTGTSTIPAGQVYYGVDIDPTFATPSPYFRAGWGSPLVSATDDGVFDWHLTNQGTIWDSSAVNYVTAVTADHLVNSGTIVAEVGPFDPPGVASMQYFTAHGVFLTSSDTVGTEMFRNTGSIYAIATSGNSVAVYTEDAQNSFVNAGLIAAQATYGADHSQTGGAQGVRLINGGNFLNDVGGQILVEGDNLAYGVYEGRGSHPASDLGTEIENRGLIHVVAGPDAARPSVGIFAVNMPTELMRIVNSGTIEADVAIYCPSDPTNAFTTSWIVNPQTVTNTATGVIQGDIQLDLGNDTLINAGMIHGTVDMGGDDDVVDNSAGTIDGVVLLGDGTDTFTGGAAADHASGGSGNDTLTGGGGADLLEGDFGNDTLDGGAGNDGLYGGVGDDVLRTSGGDIASGYVGNDRIEAGDYAFALVDGGLGYDNWVLPTGARALDLGSVAASGRVKGIEEIDLRGSQTLVVHAADIAPITGGQTLHIQGGSTDSVYLAGTWSNAGSVIEGAISYTSYQSGSSVLLVETGVHVATGSSPPSAGGLDAVAAGTAAPSPSADAETTVMSVSDFPVRHDLLITADEVWTSSDGGPVLAFAYVATPGLPYDAPDIVNLGQIINDTGVGQIANAVGGFFDYGSPDFETFSNYGLIRAETTGATTDALAFLAGSIGRLYNDGDIFAIAHGSGDATGVSTFDGTTPAVTNHSTGHILAHADSGFATGLYSAQGGSVENYGLIEAQGSTGSVGVDQFNAGGTLLNAGKIDASINAGGTGVSIGAAYYDGGSLTNTGTISADIAVYFATASGLSLAISNSGTMSGDILFDLYDPSETFGRLAINNSGTLDGSVIAASAITGTESIVNSGHITGDVDFASGNDSYDGSRGQLDGTLYGGDGNDILTGGSQTDVFFGEAGNDTMSGGGGSDGLDGGLGADTIGGGAGADFLTGGSGNDTFKDTAAGLSGDTITDFSGGDRIVITDATLAGFTFSLSGNTLTYTGGSITLSNLPHGTITATAAAGGGVQLTIAQHPANDFNGDGRSDILWRNDPSGQVMDWLGIPGGGFNGNAARSLNTVAADFQVAGTGDFNGDGRVDILWRSTSTGTIVDWLGTSTGGFAGNGAHSNNSVSTSIHVAGVGDFNGDGRSDILWMTDAGRVVDWLGTVTGGFSGNAAHSSNFVAAGWSVAGIGDFNGDGISDVLFQNGNRVIDWLGSPTGNGGFVGNAANSSGLLSVGWTVAGTGDFDGDGHDDLLLINSSTGQISDWLGTASGGFADNAGHALTSLPTGFQVAQIGDFNGDGIDDVLLRNPTTGQITDWLGNGNGSGAFTDNSAHAAATVATAWHVEPQHTALL